jgi:chromosome segregation ATPase
MIKESSTEKKAIEFSGDKLMPLLEERTLLKDRIGILDSKQEEVSEEVFQRVKADYLAKLNILNSEIGRHAKTLEATRKDYRELLDQLNKAVSHGHRSLEEMKVRFSLGEYERQEYESIGKEKKARIADYNKKMKTFNANLQRLESVLSQIDSK